MGNIKNERSNFILIGEAFMKSSENDSHTPSSLIKSFSLWNFILAGVLAPLTCYFIVFFFTSVVDFISREQWPHLPVIWPPAIYTGGIIGGTVGGFLVIWETRQKLDSNSPLEHAQLFTQDLLYLGLLAILTYILEILSESIILQALLFIFEIACFIVIGRNISRLTLKISTTSENSNNLKEDSEL